MAQQPDLFTPNPRDNPPADAPAAQQAQTKIAWTARAEAIVRIVVRLYLGLLLIALPWLAFWTQNNLFTYSPTLFALSGSGFIRGLVSGLGLLNILIALLEARNSRALS